jgi:hypothetical protein
MPGKLVMAVACKLSQHEEGEVLAYFLLGLSMQPLLHHNRVLVLQG